MAITMNGQTFRTLSDTLYLDGKRIIGAYAEDTLVYPDNTHDVIKFASAHTCDTLARWDDDSGSDYNRYCHSFNGKLLVASLFPPSSVTNLRPYICINKGTNTAHARYAPMSNSPYASQDFASFEGGNHIDDYATCLSTHSEIAMQVTADFRGNNIYQYGRYQNSIQAITSLLANGITLHFDYHEGFTDQVEPGSRSDVIVLDPREVTLGSCTETYGSSTYESTYGIRVFAGYSYLGPSMSTRTDKAYFYAAPWFVVQVVLRTSTNREAIVPIGTLFVDTVIYPNVRYIRASSRWSEGIDMGYTLWSPRRYYTDKYSVYEFTRWPTATDADRHATIAELGSLT